MTNQRQVQVDSGVTITDGCLEVSAWSTDRVETVRWFAERCAGGAIGGSELLEHVVTAGVLALRSANAVVDADYVAREVQRLLTSVDTTMTVHGDRLQGLFDPERRDSVIASIRTVMSEHVDGRDSKMAKLLDLSRDDSPLRAIVDELAKVRSQVEGYRCDVEARDAAESARATAYEIGTQKGRDFEEVVVDALHKLAAVCGDSVEAVGDVTGTSGRSKTGDVVVTVNPRDSRGVPVRLGFEAKDRSLNAKSTRVQLDATLANRDASSAVAIFARPAQMPKGTYPFAELGDNRFACLLDKGDPDDLLALTVAYRLARHWALVDMTADDATLDLRAMRDALDGARSQLQSFSLLKRRLTNLESGFGEGVCGIRDELDRARLALTDSLDRLDESMRLADDVEEEPAA